MNAAMSPKEQRVAIIALGAVIIVGAWYVNGMVRRRIERLVGPPEPTSKISERKVDGHSELSSRWFLLDGLKTGDVKRVEWSAKFNANPAKPPFVFALRALRPGWGTEEAKQPIVFVCDDRRIEWKAKQRDAEIGSVMWGVVECVGTLDDLRAAANAGRVAVSVDGVEYNLGRGGIPTLAELLKRTGRGP